MLGVLGEAEKPLKRGELVTLILAAKGAPIQPKGMLEFVHRRVPCILLGLKNRGVVGRVGAKGWALMA
jgi:hypothetical protein